MLEYFLENGVDMNAIGTAIGAGVSALHSVVLDRNPFAVALLLGNGATPDIQGEQGRTPLEFPRLRQDKDAGAAVDKIISLLTSVRALCPI